MLQITASALALYITTMLTALWLPGNLWLIQTQTDQDEKLIQFHFITFKSQLINVNVLTCFHVMSVV